jgi:Holliday junction DNA helicase RuvB
MNDWGVLDLKIKDSDDKLNNIFRPLDIGEYIGQKDLIKKLEVAIQASVERDEPLDHVIISGNPGLGKTTIAKIIAKLCNSSFHCVVAPCLNNVADLISILSDVKRKDILFIDEIHGLSKKIEEILYSAMEDFKINIKMANKSIIEIDIQPFCLVGATTQLGKVSAPLRDRFGINHNMEFYSDEEVSEIVAKNLKKIELVPEDNTVYLNIAKRSRGVPRIANRLIRRVRDFAQLYNNNIVNSEIVNKSLHLEGVDENGFTKSDKSYLLEMYRTYGCGPVGIDSISATICEDKCTVNDYIEPFLVRSKFITRTKQGRILTKDGMKYILSNLQDMKI